VSTRQFLTFTLYAPVAAFGAVAVGEQRDGWDRPARSAVLGLLAAALGIDRAEEERHAALESGYSLALRMDAPGVAFTDYHTAQIPPQRRGRQFRTRAEELAVADLQTVLSFRAYRADALCVVALWARATPPHTLDALSDALRRPAYTLYLGRRACPLGLPLRPRLIDAADALAALAMHDLERPAPEAALRRHLNARPNPVALDPDGLPPGMQADRIETRRDAVANRGRWQFALREEAVVLPATHP
jgi:CRISPR system Cascade subunit CasD